MNDLHTLLIDAYRKCPKKVTSKAPVRSIPWQLQTVFDDTETVRVLDLTDFKKLVLKLALQSLQSQAKGENDLLVVLGELDEDPLVYVVSLEGDTDIDDEEDEDDDYSSQGTSYYSFLRHVYIEAHMNMRRNQNDQQPTDE